MKVSYRPNLQYLTETAGKTINAVYNRTLDLLRRTYQSKVARRGLLTVIYLAGSANVLADNIDYSKLKPQQPTAPSGQTGSNSSKKENTGRGIDLYFEKAERYGTVDNYLYRQLPEGENRLGRIAEGVWFFPGHYIHSVRDFGYGVGVGIPTEAMNRAKAEKRAEQAKKQKTKKERNRKGLAFLLVPFDLLWDIGECVLEAGVDTLRFGKHTTIVTVEGGGRLMEYSVKNPANTAANLGATYGIASAINCIAGGDGGGDGGGVGYTGPDTPDFTGK